MEESGLFKPLFKILGDTSILGGMSVKLVMESPEMQNSNVTEDVE